MLIWKFGVLSCVSVITEWMERWLCLGFASEYSMVVVGKRVRLQMKQIGQNCWRWKWIWWRSTYHSLYFCVCFKYSAIKRYPECHQRPTLLSPIFIFLQWLQLSFTCLLHILNHGTTGPGLMRKVERIFLGLWEVVSVIGNSLATSVPFSHSSWWGVWARECQQFGMITLK